MNRVKILLLMICAGCGYGFQTSRSPLAESEGVRKIYVAPLLNNTYRAGVQNVVYNALVRALAAGGRVKVVTRPEEADAVLTAAVTEARTEIRATASRLALSELTRARQTDFPANETPPPRDVQLVSEYVGKLTVKFDLVRQNAKPGQKSILWTAMMSRARPFHATANVGSGGTTNGLINDSQFDRALSESATSMMIEVHESMLSMF